MSGKRPPGDYEVGYGKPPKKHQFKPGQSGNRQGRKKSRNAFRTSRRHWTKC